MDVRDNIDRISRINKKVDGQISNVSKHLKKMQAWKVVRKGIAFTLCTIVISAGAAAGGLKLLSGAAHISPYYQTEVTTYSSNGEISNKSIKEEEKTHNSDLISVSYSGNVEIEPENIEKFISEDYKSIFEIDNLGQLLSNGEYEIDNGEVISESSQNDQNINISLYKYSEAEYVEGEFDLAGFIIFGTLLVLVEQLLLLLIDLIIENKRSIPYTGLMGLGIEIKELESIEYMINAFKENLSAKKSYNEYLKNIKQMIDVERQLFKELEDFSNKYYLESGNAKLNQAAKYLDEIEEILSHKDEYLDKANVKKYVRI